MNNFEERFDIIPLPSAGIFYKNKCEKVKVLHLNGSDDSIFTAVNLMQSGELVDVLLRKKVRQADNYDVFVSPDEMTEGDRMAILIFLRTTLEPLYPVQAIDEKGDVFIENFDLRTLKMKRIEDMDILPDPETGLYNFHLPNENVDIKFRPLLGKDEKEIRDYQKKISSTLNEYDILKLERIVMEVDGNKDKGFISSFVKRMHLKDKRLLDKFSKDVVPTFDFNVEVKSPGGVTVTTFLRITAEFFFPRF